MFLSINNVFRILFEMKISGALKKDTVFAAYAGDLQNCPVMHRMSSESFLFLEFFFFSFSYIERALK